MQVVNGKKIGDLSECITCLEDEFDSLSVEQMHELDTVKAELNVLLDEHIQSIIFRTRSKWYEDGEKSSKYFYALEKSKYNAKTVTALFDSEDKLVDTPWDILQLQKEFYQNLYSKDDNVIFDLKGENTQVQNITIHLQTVSQNAK